MMRPLHDCIIVKMDAPAERVGSIFVPSASSQMQRTGTVVAVGPGTPIGTDSYAPIDVSVGDKVMFLKWNLIHKNGKAWAGALDDEGMQDHVLVRERDILLTYPADEPHDFAR